MVLIALILHNGGTELYCFKLPTSQISTCSGGKNNALESWYLFFGCNTVVKTSWRKPGISCSHIVNAQTLTRVIKHLISKA